MKRRTKDWLIVIGVLLFIWSIGRDNHAAGGLIIMIILISVSVWGVIHVIKSFTNPEGK